MIVPAASGIVVGKAACNLDCGDDQVGLLDQVGRLRASQELTRLRVYLIDECVELVNR